MAHGGQDNATWTTKILGSSRAWNAGQGGTCQGSNQEGKSQRSTVRKLNLTLKNGLAWIAARPPGLRSEKSFATVEHVGSSIARRGGAWGAALSLRPLDLLCQHRP